MKKFNQYTQKVWNSLCLSVANITRFMALQPKAIQIMFILIVLLMVTSLLLIRAKQTAEINHLSGASRSTFEPYTRKIQSKQNLTELEQANAHSPKNVSTLSDLAVAYYNSQNYDKSIATYNDILSVNPESAFAYNGLGNVFRDQADTAPAAHQNTNRNLAEANYRKAIQVDKKYSIAYSNLAQLLMSDRKSEALAVIKSGLKEMPNNPDLSGLLKVIGNS